jgi:hypothetical protein
MPMPPPKPSTEGPRDRQVVQEMYQIVRALEANGPLQADELRRLVGADYWEAGRFDRAVVLAVSDGLVHRTSDGALATA